MGNTMGTMSNAYHPDQPARYSPLPGLPLWTPHHVLLHLARTDEPHSSPA